MKIALLHVDVSGGPENRNLTILNSAINQAADAGAEWIVTPETAVQGYFFAVERDSKPLEVPVQPSAAVATLQNLAAARQVSVFLCCAEQDEISGKYYNSCLVLGADGQVLGRHRKKQAHRGVSEGWAEKGDKLEPIQCADKTAGILICADSWYEENAVELANKGAEVIIVPAAWPPNSCGGPPEIAWKKASVACRRPLWVCNQTGKQERLDFTHAQSAVVINGQMRLEYTGEPAVLLFDWDFKRQSTSSSAFEVLAVNSLMKRGLVDE